MLYCILCFVFIVNIQGAPKRDFALIYLTRFGYFDSGTKIGQFSDEFKDALLQFQSKAGLEVTGSLNDETINMMNQPRCGFKDTVGTASDYRSRRYALQGSSWRGSHIKYTVSKYPQRVQKKNIDQEVARAFSVWSKHADLKFIPSSDKADIEIKFEKYDHGDENPFDGKGGVLAHANFPTNGGAVHFDASEDWGINSTDTSKKDLYKTAAHEIGHALGLGHSDVLHSLMAPFYNPSKSDALVTDDDIQAIQALYGKKSDIRPNNLHKNMQDLIFCRDAKIDAIFTSDVNGDVCILKKDHYWKISQNGSIYNGYPKQITSHWPHLPTPIDAAFTDATGKTYFFKSSQVWRYNANHLNVGYPQKILEAFPGAPDHVDTAFMWSGNGKLYLFKGSNYWKCDIYKKSCSTENYPRSISRWKGIPDNVDAAFHSGDGYTYFFKDDTYYKFDDHSFSVTEEDPPYPRSTAKWWFGC